MESQVKPSARGAGAALLAAIALCAPSVSGSTGATRTACRDIDLGDGL